MFSISLFCNHIPIYSLCFYVFLSFSIPLFRTSPRWWYGSLGKIPPRFVLGLLMMVLYIREQWWSRMPLGSRDLLLFLLFSFLLLSISFSIFLPFVFFWSCIKIVEGEGGALRGADSRPVALTLDHPYLRGTTMIWDYERAIVQGLRAMMTLEQISGGTN